MRTTLSALKPGEKGQIEKVSGSGAAARRGIIIRGGDVLETLGKVNGVVFDKTGTLTRGTPRVMDVKRICGHPEKDVLKFAAGAEKLSEHPLAGAILDKAKKWDLLVSAPKDFRVRRGRGVEVKHDGLRALYAEWALDGDGPESMGADRQYGWYVEPSYRVTEAVGVFARYNEWDNQAGSSDTVSRKRQWDAGVNWWPHEQVVVKADYQWQDNKNGKDQNGFNLGVGYEF